MKAENKGMLVRGVVGVGNRNISCITHNLEEMQKRGAMLAFTHWYRHDDNLEELDREFEKLAKCYMSMEKTTSLAQWYEYKEYEK